MTKLPSWKIHEKWGLKFGISPRVLSSVNAMIDSIDQQRRGRNIKRMFHHDWGRGKSKAERSIQKSFVRMFYGEEGIKAAELHHMLDYLERLCNPEKLAKDEIRSMIFKMTSGFPLSQRMEIHRDVLPTLKGAKADVEKVLGFRSPPKSFIVNMLFRKAKRLEVSGETKKFIQHNLGEILQDIGCG